MKRVQLEEPAPASVAMGPAPALPEPIVKKVGRPSKLVRIAPDRPMPKRVKTIAEYHQAVIGCLAQGAFYAVMCGMELHAANRAVPHGEWETWLKENCPFSGDTARHYMSAAERKMGRINQLKAVSLFSLGVSPQSLSAEQRAKLLACVRDATDGESVQQLYLECGITKQRTPQGAAKSGAKVDPPPVDKQALREKIALDDLKAWQAGLQTWISKRHYRHVGNVDLERAHQTLEAARSLIPRPLFTAEERQRVGTEQERQKGRRNHDRAANAGDGGSVAGDGEGAREAGGDPG